MRLHTRYILPYEPTSTVCRDAETRRRVIKQRLLQREFELGMSDGAAPLRLDEPNEGQGLGDWVSRIKAH